VTDSVYAPARNFCERQLRVAGIDVEYYDPLVGARIAESIRPDTVGVYCESPGSLTFEVQDIPAIAAAAHERGVPVIADNTWGTPYFFPSFERGVDISIHAATKYLSGHSDVMMGMVVTNERYWDAVRQTVNDYGYGVSPDDCYLVMRGVRTMGVRLRQQMENALRVASWLASSPHVARVNYPALETDPGHTLWKRDFRGAASLFAVELKPASESALTRFVNSLELFGIGSSWGGYESLINVVRASAHRTRTEWKPEGPVVRLHIGLESPADLISDLDRALATFGKSAEEEHR
jgi:cystathionine beta-lyase